MKVYVTIGQSKNVLITILTVYSAGSRQRYILSSFELAAHQCIIAFVLYSFRIKQSQQDNCIFVFAIIEVHKI
jgi:hypothetical protein